MSGCLARVTQLLGTGQDFDKNSALMLLAERLDGALQRIDELEEIVYDQRPITHRANTTVIPPSQGGQ